MRFLEFLAEGQKRRFCIAGSRLAPRPRAPLPLDMIHIIARQQRFCLLHRIAPQGGQAPGYLVEIDKLDGSGQTRFAAEAIRELGAQAVMVARATLYGLIAGGEAGVERALTILTSEIDRVLGQLGCNSLADLNPGFMRRM